MTTQYQPEDEGSEFFDEEYRPCLYILHSAPSSHESRVAQTEDMGGLRSDEDLPTYAEEVRRYYDGM